MRSVGLILCLYMTFVRCNKPNIWPWNIGTEPLPTPIQSPINIETNKIRFLDMPPLQYNDFDIMNETDIVKCQNDGNSLQCSMETERRPSIKGGPLNGRYIFQNIHFHWGTNDSYGSEHKIDGKTWPIEMHFVLFRQEYINVMTAMRYQDGLAVLAFFGEITKNDSKDFAILFNDAENLAPYMSSVSRPWPVVFPFVNKLIVIGPEPNQEWITYPGALTAPPYFWESVTWILYNNTFEISSKQLASLRRLVKADGTKNTEHTLDVVKLGDRRFVYTRSMRGNRKIQASTTSDSLSSFVQKGFHQSHLFENFIS